MANAEASPYKSVAEDLTTLRKTLRTACRCFQERLEAEINRVQEQVVARSGDFADGKSAGDDDHGPPVGHKRSRGVQAVASRDDTDVRALRDMLTLLRTLETKPEAGRRKDLKKIESLVEDLHLLTAHWT